MKVNSNLTNFNNNSVFNSYISSKLSTRYNDYYPSMIIPDKLDLKRRMNNLGGID